VKDVIGEGIAPAPFEMDWAEFHKALRTSLGVTAHMHYADWARGLHTWS
jgi:hypothetical protein